MTSSSEFTAKKGRRPLSLRTIVLVAIAVLFTGVLLSRPGSHHAPNAEAQGEAGAARQFKIPDAVATAPATATMTNTRVRTNTRTATVTPGGPTFTPTSTSTATPSCLQAWSIVSSPNAGSNYSFLLNVAVASPDDIWAVGYYHDNDIRRTLIEHWDGAQWGIVDSPNASSADNVLQGVAVVSPSDMWAVGYYSNSSGTNSLTLVEHWNGSDWSVVTSPNVGSYSNVLNSVVAASSGDVWAVGAAANDSSHSQTLAMRWNGTQWRVVGSANVLNSVSDTLLSISAISREDAWAVGTYATSSGLLRALTQHWDGYQWSLVTSPTAGAYDYQLSGVVAIASDDVWAVGSYRDARTNPYQPLTEHWDGAQWNVVAGPGSTQNRSLKAVAARTSSDVWAVGGFSNSSATVIEHWDGAQWSVVNSPSPPGTTAIQFNGVAARPDSDVWTVGSFFDGVNPTQTLVERYSCDISTNMLIGHVTWQARPAQPNLLQQVPITLTLKLDATELNYPANMTDQYGFFTVTIGSLPSGTYSWRVDDTASKTHSPNYLAKSGVVDITGAPVTNLNMGLMKAGDASNDNTVNVSDFNITKVTFGFSCGMPSYDNRADYTGDCFVNVSDFNALKVTFGQGGDPPISPGSR